MNKTFNDYYNELNTAYENDTLFFCNNTDRLHNAAIMLLMLDKSSDISMFCGCMSIFRNNFYSLIDPENKGIGNKIKNRIAQAFERVVNTDGATIKIILENYDDSILEDLIFDKELIKSQAVKLFEVPDYIKNKNEIGHFSFTGDQRIVRVETDAERHEAICKIGTEATLASPEQSFNTLIDLSRRIAV